MSTIVKSISSGVFYIAVGKYSRVVISIIIGAILARLLTPTEFGIVALVTVFVTFFNLLADFGIGKAVVQNQKLSDDDVESLFTFSLMFSFILAGSFYLSSTIISGFYNEPELVSITKLLSLGILFYSAHAIPKAILEKNLRFKKIGYISVLINVMTGVFAIILAYKGFSYYSLVYRNILGGFLLFFIYLILSGVKFTFRPKIKALRKVISFSSYNFLFNFINYFSRNGDNLLIGKFLGATSLGYYEKSYRLMMLPVHNLTHVFTPVLMPVLSKHQDDKEIIFSTYKKVIKVLATLGFPLSMFLFFSSYEIINIFYGPQWDQSIPVFKILSLTIGIQIVYSTAGSIFQAIDRTKLLFYYGIIGAVILLSGISYGVFIGQNIVAVGYGILIAFILNFVVVFYILIKIALQKSLINFFSTLIHPLITTFFVALSLWAYSFYSSTNIYIAIIIKLVIVLIIGSAISLLSKENRRIFKGLIQKRTQETI